MERQLTDQISDIRPDHLARYAMAQQLIGGLGLNSRVLDLGCGIGYGSSLLASVSKSVTSVEISAEAFDIYAKNFKKKNIKYLNQSAESYLRESNDSFSSIVSFEFLEHIPEKLMIEILQLVGHRTEFFIFSTPNELVRPHAMEPVNPFHFKHYTPDEMSEHVRNAGFQDIIWWNQKSGKDYNLKKGTEGKFIIGAAFKSLSLWKKMRLKYGFSQFQSTPL